MIPKVEACLETLNNGVRKIHIIDGRLRHSLLLEVYTSTGVGTEPVGPAGRTREPAARPARRTSFNASPARPELDQPALGTLP
jgi:acetylglutamate kinase